MVAPAYRSRFPVIVPFEDKEKIKACPGSKWHAGADKHWSLPVSPLSAQRVHGYGWSVRPEDETMYRRLLGIYEMMGELARTNPADLEPPPRTKLKPRLYQIEGYHLLRIARRALFGWDMGTGKTKGALDCVFNLPGILDGLILAPVSVCPVWVAEVAKHLPDGVLCRVLNLAGSGTVAKKAERAAQFLDAPAKPGEIRLVVINYESAWRPAFAAFVESRRWGIGILDEIHRIKSHDSIVNRFCTRVLRDRCTYRLGLTGTVLHNTPLDAYGQLLFIDPAVFGESIWRFRARYSIPNPHFPKQITGYQNLDEMQKRMARYVLRVDADDVLDLPAWRDEVLPVVLPPDPRRAYKELEREFIAQIQDKIVTAANGAVKGIRLQQMTSGFVVDEEDRIAEVHDAKADRLIEFLSDLPADEPVPVFCMYRQDIARVVRAASQAGRESLLLCGGSNQLEAWKQNHANAEVGKRGGVLAVQPKSGGVGVDMTIAKYAVYYSLGYISPGDYDQTRSRIRRHGQTRDVIWYHIVATDTVDELVYESIKNKKDTITGVIDGLKAKSLGGKAKAS